ncbi:HET-domain-containing protein [Cucurbitaria berberidis CBS 394.84]|uniref:HET-domain-containing protein n=1 Tax=Cucurbitaria berberidis CBS 394.84 TaxID=1168544 RepID=A0A9P4GKF0_9PLEO|nr:HET-domain-containing protein [Cucurbitaria berberidis CBS 394.84]KAF1847215.1 HET-domain-containing protein [Cucurbitaria berberidis CBS 394.84]
MGNEHFDYVVLSHMWGDKKKQLRLLEQNFLVFQREVPQAKLDASSTFKEAIRITRILGYRYLWIDSLCIIQDVPSDWKYEAHRMATVYGNAICNLSFLFPPGDEPEPRCDPRAWIPCVLRPASSSRPGIYMEHETNVYTRLRNSNRIPRDWPLFGRAWTFQEYLLSPRTLLIGSQNLMWQCSRGFYDELLGPVAEHVTTAEKAKLTKNMGKSRYFPRSIQTIAKASSLSEPSVLDFMIDWQNLINEYQARRLTVAKDRVVAFAGIARAFQNLGQLTYLAGAWKEVFPLCLLWFVDKKTTHQVRYEDSIPNGPMPDSAYTREIWEPVVQPAPSWSWFSVPIYRYYKLFFVIGENEADISYENELSVRCRGNLNPSRLHFDDIFWVEGCKFQFGSSGPNCFQETGFYEFADLQVTLEMPVLPVKVNWPQDIYEQLWWIQDNGSDDDRDVKWMLAFNYYPDVPFGRKSPPRNAIYALIAEYQIVREAGFQRRLAGLMLIPGPQPGTWTRNGVWMLKIRLSNVLVTTENIPSVAQRWRNYAIISSKWHTETITLV